MTGDVLGDQAAAALDLVGRTGARELKVGYLHDDVPPADASWYAQVQYRGARIIVEDQPGPAEALEALAFRLLKGAQCAHCKGLVSLSSAGAVFYPGAVYPSGLGALSEAEARSRPLCRWRRVGAVWKRGCER